MRKYIGRKMLTLALISIFMLNVAIMATQNVNAYRTPNLPETDFDISIPNSAVSGYTSGGGDAIRNEWWAQIPPNDHVFIDGAYTHGRQVSKEHLLLFGGSTSHTVGITFGATINEPLSSTYSDAQISIFTLSPNTDKAGLTWDSKSFCPSGSATWNVKILCDDNSGFTSPFVLWSNTLTSHENPYVSYYCSPEVYYNLGYTQWIPRPDLAFDSDLTPYEFRSSIPDSEVASTMYFKFEWNTAVTGAAWFTTIRTSVFIDEVKITVNGDPNISEVSVTPTTLYADQSISASYSVWDDYIGIFLPLRELLLGIDPTYTSIYGSHIAEFSHDPANPTIYSTVFTPLSKGLTAPGVYTLRFRICETSNVVSEKTKSITILNTNPTASIQSTLIPSVSGNKFVRWLPSDINVDTDSSYTITFDGDIIASGTGWRSGQLISANIESYPAGVEYTDYDAILTLNDGFGGTFVDTKTVRITQVNMAWITEPQEEIDYAYGSTGNMVHFDFLDIGTSSSWTYQIRYGEYPAPVFKSGSVSEGGSDGNGNNVNIDGLSIGYHHLSIYLLNDFGDMLYSEFRVSCYNHAPLIVPERLNYVIYDGMPVPIQWQVFDSDIRIGTYTIIDGMLSTLRSGNWVSGDIISFMPPYSSGNSMGFTLKVDDGSGEIKQSMVVWTYLSGITTITANPYVYGTTGNTLKILIDGYYSYQSEVKVYKDNALYWSGNVQSDIPMYVNIDGLSEGFSHGFRIDFIESPNRYGYSITKMIDVLDDDTTAPSVSAEYIGDYTEYNAGQVIFTATDPSGIFGDSEKIFDVPAIAGTYHFEWTFTDADNERIYDSLSTTKTYDITITDGDNQAPDISIIYNGLGTDGNAGTFDVIATDDYGLIVDPSCTMAVPNDLGLHAWSFTAIDNSFAQKSSTLNYALNIRDDDTIAPTIVWEYFGDYSNVNPGYISVSAYDASGLTVDPSGIYYLEDVYGVPQTFTFTAIDSDMDRADDQLTTIEIAEITLTRIVGVYVTDYNANCGFGSERFGVTIDYNFNELTTVYLAVEEQNDRDGDGNLNERYSAITQMQLIGEGSTELIAKILFNEVGKTTDGISGEHYRWHIWTDTGIDQHIDGIGLYHWSTFQSLVSKVGYWQANVRWDAISAYLPTTHFKVYVQMRYWDKTAGILYNVQNSTGSNVIASQDILSLEAGSAILNITKPDTYVKVATPYDGATWMNAYGSGYYFFTYIAEDGAYDPWLARIGCPSEYTE